MDSTQIELLSASKVKGKIVSTDKLRPYISENDKTPVWDGTVLLYKKSNHLGANKYIFGRVEVQVKGELNDNLSKQSISYSIGVDDLNVYMNSGGVIFFVVYINIDNPDSQKIYYETLTPVKIKRYLKGKETQQTLTVKFRELPLCNKDIERIFFNFCEDKNKQYSFRDKPLISLEDITKRKDIKSIKCEYIDFQSDKSILNPIKYFFQNDICFYAEIEGSSIPHPIDIAGYNLAFIKDGVVSINGKVYEDYLKVVQRRDEITLEFGKSLIITFTNGSDQWSVTYTPTHMLSHRIKDLEFFINAVESKEIVLVSNEMTIPLSGLGDDIEYDIDFKKKELEQCNRIRLFLESLHVVEDLDLAEVAKNSSWNELMAIVKGFLDEESISFTAENYEKYLLYPKELGNLKILFFLEKANESNNHYFIQDYFNSEFILKRVYDNNVEHITSIYSAMTPEDYNELSNLTFSKMLDSYKPFSEWNKDIFGAANFDLLNLLTAYDSSEKPKQIILETAKDIAKWILDESGDNIPDTVKLLNYFQVLKREGALGKEEQNKLLQIMDTSTMDRPSIIAANLLLDNQIAAEWHFDKLDDGDKKTFRSFPINKFWKGK